MCENLNMYSINASWKKAEYYWEVDSVVLDVFLENLSGVNELVLSSRNLENEEFLGLLKYVVPQKLIEECVCRFKHNGRSKEDQSEWENKIDYHNDDMDRSYMEIDWDNDWLYYNDSSGDDLTLEDIEEGYAV